MRALSFPRRILAAGAAMALCVAVYFCYDPSVAAFFPPCPFHWLTGLYCPGCGSQRAFHALLHGRLLEAASDNLLALLFLPLLVYGAVVYAATAGTRGPVLFYRPWFGRLVLLAVITFGLLRNLPWLAFHWLAP